MKNLFQTKKKSVLVRMSDAKKNFTDSQYIQYEKFRLNDNFRQFTKTIMSSIKIFRMVIQKTSLQNHMK